MNTTMQTWLARLKPIVEAWPNAVVHSDSIPTKLKYLVTDDFDRLDLLHEISAVVEISKLEIETDKATIEFLDSGGTPQRAVFKNVGPDEWKLQSLKFQCSICFGSGINDGKECLLCDGVGWGAG